MLGPDELVLVQPGDQFQWVGPACFENGGRPYGVAHDVHELRMPDVVGDPTDQPAVEPELADELRRQRHQLGNGTGGGLETGKHPRQRPERLDTALEFQGDQAPLQVAQLRATGSADSQAALTATSADA